MSDTTGGVQPLSPEDWAYLRDEARVRIKANADHISWSDWEIVKQADEAVRRLTGHQAIAWGEHPHRSAPDWCASQDSRD